VAEEQKTRGTQVHSPSLDWSQIRETVLMLELATGQIGAALNESNAPVNTLTEGFTSLATLIARIQTSLDALPETPENDVLKHALLGSTGEVSSVVQESVVAFQFYDRLSQRLDHVCHALSRLSELVSDASRRFSITEWAALQDTIRAHYSTPEEIAMFEAVLSGMPVQEALQQFVAERREKTANDVELF